MTLDEFVTKYNSNGIDFDNYYGFQCMDLYRQYVKECLGLPQSPAVAGAKDVWTTYLKDKYDRFENSPTAVPIRGDIIIWGAGAGPYGHIAVCTEANINDFKSFDQNWPVNSLCHIQPHNYTNVLGWLRAKPTVQPEVPYGQLKIDLVAPYGTQEVQAINSMLLDKDRILKANIDTMNQLNNQIKELEKIYEDGLIKNERLIDKISDVQDIVFGKGWTWVKINNLKKLLN